MGDFNSVILIEKAVTDNNYLHLLSYDEQDETITYKFYYESVSRDFITPENIVALIHNYKVKKENIKLDENHIKLVFNKIELKGDKTVRIAVSKGGNATDFQTLRLVDGVPIGKNDFYNWNDAIIYSIMIDRFYDGDTTNSIPVDHPELSIQANYQGGDLQGIIDKLEEGYFDSLGVNTFWISPIIDNTNNAYKEYPPPHRYFTGYHGYWPISETRVEEHFGDMPLVKKFVEIAHKHGATFEHPNQQRYRRFIGRGDFLSHLGHALLNGFRIKQNPNNVML